MFLQFCQAAQWQCVQPGHNHLRSELGGFHGPAAAQPAQAEPLQALLATRRYSDIIIQERLVVNFAFFYMTVLYYIIIIHALFILISEYYYYINKNAHQQLQWFHHQSHHPGILTAPPSVWQSDGPHPSC